jgi:hypothetical protein
LVTLKRGKDYSAVNIDAVQACIKCFALGVTAPNLMYVGGSMKNRIIPAALLAGIFMVGSALAQDWYHQREQAFAGNNWRPQLFSQVRSDLDHIYSAEYAGGNENRRIQQTKDRLSKLQDDMDHGRDDNNLLNDVVNEMENTAKDNRLSPRDREVVADDVNRLHEFQRSPVWHR